MSPSCKRSTVGLALQAALLGSAAAVVEGSPHLHAHPHLRHGHHRKPTGGGFPPELGSLLAESQSRLAAAEKHHEGVVGTAKGRLHDLLATEASALASALQNYSAALSGAAHGLATTANATKSAIDADERKAAGKPGEGWGGPEVEARAKLSAQVQLVDRESKRMRRQQDRLLGEGTRQAGDILEDAASRLSRKLGDTSAVVDEAKAALLTSPGDVVGSPASAQPSAELKGQDKVLASATSAARGKVKDAQKTFDAVIDVAKKGLDKGVTLISQDLDEAQKEELHSIHAAATPAPKN